MLINLRNALMTGKRLPYDAEVEFLESTGTQWIDTGVVFSKFYSFALRARLTPTYNESDLFGAYYQTDMRKMVCGIYRNFIFGFNPPGTRIDSATLGTSEIDVDISYEFSSTGARTLTVNGAAYTASTGYITNRNITLFRGNPDYDGSFKCYSFKIYDTDGTTLLRDFIPVRVGTVGYLYDRVSGKLFGNAGSGDFVLGQDVVPVEYIESTGAQYIVTPKILNSNTEEGAYIEVDVRPQAQAQAQYGVIYSQGSSVFNSPFSILANRGASTTTAFFTGVGEVAVSTTGDRIKVGVKHKTSNSWDIFADGTNVGSSNMSGSYAFGETSFGAFNAGASKVASGTRFYSVSSSAYNLRPVRVGTGSTWEGAMMDTLTRRIYRNAGTGAFAYGNDLKYPIPA